MFLQLFENVILTKYGFYTFVFDHINTAFDKKSLIVGGKRQIVA